VRSGKVGLGRAGARGGAGVGAELGRGARKGRSVCWTIESR
jgi:hypothetical protein